MLCFLSVIVVLFTKSLVEKLKRHLNVYVSHFLPRPAGGSLSPAACCKLVITLFSSRVKVMKCCDTGSRPVTTLTHYSYKHSAAPSCHRSHRAPHHCCLLLLLLLLHLLLLLLLQHMAWTLLQIFTLSGIQSSPTGRKHTASLSSRAAAASSASSPDETQTTTYKMIVDTNHQWRHQNIITILLLISMWLFIIINKS